jgi:arabinogalactan endo-1,4-beta-galactosidase
VVLHPAGRGAAAGAAGGLSVDVAVGAGATASSAAGGAPEGSAVDGSASTAWCAAQWSGSLVVDLGRRRALDGIGVTLGAGASASTASVELADGSADDAADGSADDAADGSAGRAAGWRAVGAARGVALDGGEPSYVPLPAGTAARYARLTVGSVDGSAACVGEFRLFGRGAAADRMMLGADLSFVPQELAAGATFTDAGKTADPVRILRAHGANYVRMRLWVDPPAGYSDLAADLALARRVRAAGMKVYLDLHYSDFWADPQHEDTPAAWRGQDLATLAGTVRAYTKDVLAAFARQGTPVDLVSIGNEIRNGMLWPVGQLDWAADTGWDNLATLLRAGVDGARQGNPRGHGPRVMLHFDQGGDSAASARFFGELVARGVPFDVIGLSYYPFWHGTVSQLRSTVDALANRFGKDVAIAETQYAWTLANGDTTGDFVWQPGQLSAGYPASAGGQLSLMNDLLSILAAVPGGHGAGLFYWEPAWIPGVGWEPGAGTPNDNLTLFDFQGRALPSVGLFENPVAVCARYDRYGVPCRIPS